MNERINNGMNVQLGIAHSSQTKLLQRCSKMTSDVENIYMMMRSLNLNSGFKFDSSVEVNRINNFFWRNKI